MNRPRQFPRALAVIAAAFLAAGAGLAAGPLAHGIIGQVSAAQAKSIWEKAKHPRVASFEKNPSEPGQPALWVSVPSCKIGTLVLEESDAEALHRFPALRQLDSGARVVYAHRDLHFRALAGIRTGDEIRVETRDGRVTAYTVRAIRILLPEQVSPFLDDPENRESLNLLTCYPFRYLGAAPQRFLVTATRRSS